MRSKKGFEILWYPPSPIEMRQIRRRLNLSLQDLAAALGVSKDTVWRWERPLSSPHHADPPPFLRRALRDLERELRAIDRERRELERQSEGAS